MRQLFTTATTLAALFLAGTSPSLTQEESEGSIKDLAFLIGNWSVEISYANGAKATGSRVCEYALDGVYIKCTADTKFAEAASRRTVSYFNYNAGNSAFEEATVFQAPALKKLADFKIDADKATASLRGYIYGGEGKIDLRTSEQWVFTDNTIEIEARLNSSAQPGHEWPVFTKQKITKK